MASSVHGNSFLKFNAPLLSSKPEALSQLTPKELDSIELEDLGPDLEVREITVPEEMHLQRLDVVLTAVLPDFSRNFVQQLISESCVERVSGNGHFAQSAGSQGQAYSFVTKSSSKAHAFETYRLTLKPSPQALAYKPQEMQINVLFEDAHILVINKPANLVVHPAPGNWGGTLLNGLLFLDPTFAPNRHLIYFSLQYFYRCQCFFDALTHHQQAQRATFTFQTCLKTKEVKVTF